VAELWVLSDVADALMRVRAREGKKKSLTLSIDNYGNVYVIFSRTRKKRERV
jgi:hypothetical protein